MAFVKEEWKKWVIEAEIKDVSLLDIQVFVKKLDRLGKRQSRVLSLLEALNDSFTNEKNLQKNIEKYEEIEEKIISYQEKADTLQDQYLDHMTNGLWDFLDVLKINSKKQTKAKFKNQPLELKTFILNIIVKAQDIVPEGDLENFFDT